MMEKRTDSIPPGKVEPPWGKRDVIFPNSIYFKIYFLDLYPALPNPKVAPRWLTKYKNIIQNCKTHYNYPLKEPETIKIAKTHNGQINTNSN